MVLSWNRIILHRHRIILRRDRTILRRRRIVLHWSKIVLHRNKIILRRNRTVLLRDRIILFRDRIILLRDKTILRRSRIAGRGRNPGSLRRRAATGRSRTFSEGCMNGQLEHIRVELRDALEACSRRLSIPTQQNQERKNHEKTTVLSTAD